MAEMNDLDLATVLARSDLLEDMKTHVAAARGSVLAAGRVMLEGDDSMRAELDAAVAAVDALYGRVVAVNREYTGQWLRLGGGAR
jgi:hypothetical protein